MNFHCLKVNELLKKLNSTLDGLTTSEANKRLLLYGKNKIEIKKNKPLVLKFLNQFKDLMIIVLLIASIFSAIVSYYNHESYIDSIIIIVIVLLNAILGFVQELKSEKAINELKQLQTTMVKVKRDNSITLVNSEKIVKGDIIILEAGDTVPADSRVIYCASLKVDESSLTGESIPVEKEETEIEKSTPLLKRSNMIYSGSNVVYGKCEAVVCETGDKTEFGKIAKTLVVDIKELTPLEKKVNDISKILSLIIFIIIIIMFIIGVIKGISYIEIIMLSISLAVAAIPEGLPAIITITLSVGMQQLAKKKAIVRTMASVETLGSTEIICSDKTGTITSNKMTVKEIFYNNNLYKVGDFSSENVLAKAMILNNDSSIKDEISIGDPTEIALLDCFAKTKNFESIKESKRVGELPFDSNRKMMSVVIQDKNEICVYSKGSFDSIINSCNFTLKNNKTVKLTNKERENLKDIEKSLSEKAYRVLSFAYKKLNKKYKLDSTLEEDLVFIGMVAMIDPPREDVKESIMLCKSANIKPIMITGDSLDTAKAIAKEIGILTDSKEAITGQELDKMSFKQLSSNIENYSVYARVSPMNKLDIVNAWKEKGKVVAMTGDGVNDAPAIKAGNIGIGMGITGTEVSKSVSDIILADDSFSSIVTAVKEGRRIFDNIRGALVYLLTGNIAEVIIVFIGVLAGITIFSPLQLLYINLITDSLPAIALAFEKESNDVMTRKVRKNNSTFFTPFLVTKIGFSAILKTITILLVYVINLKNYGFENAITMSFLALILTEMIYAYSCRNLKNSVINKNIFGNSFMNKSMVILLIVQIIIFTTPVKAVFGITNISLLQLLCCVLIVLIMFIIDESCKKIIDKYFSD